MPKIRRSRRSWPQTLRFLIAAAVSGGIAAFLITNDFVEGPITGFITLLPAVFAVVMVIQVFRRPDSGSCPCPRCGSILKGLALESNDAVLCYKCRRYLEGKDGSLWETEDNRVADRPLFRSRLPERPTLPGECCVCGNSEVRRDEIILTAEETQSWKMISETIKDTHHWKVMSVRVPHCDEHKNGAMLALGPQPGPYIKFRSHPYLRAFCQLNGTEPE